MASWRSCSIGNDTTKEGRRPDWGSNRTRMTARTCECSPPSEKYLNNEMKLLTIHGGKGLLLYMKEIAGQGILLYMCLY